MRPRPGGTPQPSDPRPSAVVVRGRPAPGEAGASRVLPPPGPESEVASGAASGGSPALAALAPWRMGIGAQDARPEGSWKAERRELPPPRRSVSVPAVKKESETGTERGSSEQPGGQEKRSVHGQETPKSAPLGPPASQVDGAPASARSNRIPRDPPVLPRNTSGGLKFADRLPPRVEVLPGPAASPPAAPPGLPASSSPLKALAAGRRLGGRGGRGEARPYLPAGRSAPGSAAATEAASRRAAEAEGPADSREGLPGRDPEPDWRALPRARPSPAQASYRRGHPMAKADAGASSVAGEAQPSERRRGKLSRGA